MCELKISQRSQASLYIGIKKVKNCNEKSKHQNPSKNLLHIQVGLKGHHFERGNFLLD